MQIERCYTRPGRDALAGQPMRRVRLATRGAARVPQDWPTRAAIAFAGQLPGWDGEAGITEATEAFAARLVSDALSQSRFADAAQAQLWADEMRHMILHRIVALDPAFWPGARRAAQAPALPLRVAMARAAREDTARLARAAWDGAPLDLVFDPARAEAGPQIVLDLRRFVRGGELAEEMLAQAVRVWTLALAVLAARPGGPAGSLGLAGLGGALMRLGLGYASREGRAAAAGIVSRIEAARLSVLADLGLSDAGGEAGPRLVVAPLGTQAAILGLGADPLAPQAALLVDREVEGAGHRRVAAPELRAGLEAQGHAPDRVAALLRHVAGHGSLVAAPGLDHAALRACGLDAAQIARIEAALPEARDLRAVITPWRLGRAFCESRLGLDPAALPGHGLGLLERLGFSEAQIDAANAHVFGTGTLRGAPGIAPDQAAAFECACDGAGGAGRVTASARIVMAAAVAGALRGPVTALLPLPDAARPATAWAAIRAARRAGLSGLVISRDTVAAGQAGEALGTPALAPRLREILAMLPPDTRPGSAPEEVIALLDAAARSRPEARRHARALRERVLADPLPKGRAAPRAAGRAPRSTPARDLRGG